MEKAPVHLTEQYTKHPWLHYHPDTITTYLPPNYYDSILKPYTIGGRSDLDLFLDNVRTQFRPPSDDILEMGSGSGRATDALLATGIPFNRLDLVDLSTDMIAQNKEKYAGIPGVSVFESDILDFLQSTPESYSYAFSLWGFSYSVHHHMNRLGIRAGARHAEDVITEFLTDKLRPGGTMFIVHPDILSDEQYILKRLRQPTVARTKDRQSSSKRLLDSIIAKLEQKGQVKADVAHIVGDPIKYASVDEAMEIFLNFHMHGSLNRSRRLPQALETLETEFAKYRVGDEVHIAPGWFNYSITTQG